MSREDHKPVPHNEPAIIPFDVRYALQYRQAEMGVDEVLSLRANFEPLCLYGVSKLLHAEAKLQRLPSLLQAHLMGDTDGFIEASAEALFDVASTIAMPKIAEHSRRLYATDLVYQAAAIRHRGVPVYLMAHSTLVGIRVFHAARETGYHLLYEPNQNSGWQMITIETSQSNVGEPASAEVALGEVVLDDIRNTGATEDLVTEQFAGATFDVVGSTKS